MSRHRAKGKPEYRRYKRYRLWLIQNGLCCICGEPMNLDVEGTHPDYPTFEHATPYSVRRTMKLVALAHRRCNETRGNPLHHCGIAGCERPAFAYGMCMGHYAVWASRRIEP